MPQKKESPQEKIVVTKNKSGLSQFMARPVPTQEEVESFEDFFQEEKRDSEIEDNLQEIYQDKKGGKIDVSTINKRHRHGFAFWFFTLIFILAIGGGLAYGIYYNSNNPDRNKGNIDLSVVAPDKVVAGEEFIYKINYANKSGIAVHDAVLELKYPDNFVFIEADPSPDMGNFMWQLGNVAAHSDQELSIKGKILAAKGDSQVLEAKFSYVPDNFSSQFKEEARHNLLLSDIGLNTILDYSNTALIGAENKVQISIRPNESSFISDFYLSFEGSANVIIDDLAVVNGDDFSEEIELEKQDDNIWKISGFKATLAELDLELIFKVQNSEDASDQALIRMDYFHEEEEGEPLYFFSKEMVFLVMESDLNLSLTVNGAKSNKAVNFGDVLNYVIGYSNQGEVALEDIMIVAVIEGDMLDWNSLTAPVEGQVGTDTIVWTKEDLPALAKLEPGQSGEISFSLQIRDFADDDLSKNTTISSYAKFILGVEQDGDEDNDSNRVVNLINSDLKFIEKVRYFNEDNLVVGSGPLPPQTGEKTSFKVYWVLQNNLHELNNVRTMVDLPDYVSWDGSENASVGNIFYDSNNHRVIWDLGRMPISVYQSEADFNISIEPSYGDRNKILVLSTGSYLEALDTETNDTLRLRTTPKTTRLEDDDIANINNDGLVR